MSGGRLCEGKDAKDDDDLSQSWLRVEAGKDDANPYTPFSPPCATETFCNCKVPHLEVSANDGSTIGRFRN